MKKTWVTGIAMGLAAVLCTGLLAGCSTGAGGSSDKKAAAGAESAVGAENTARSGKTDETDKSAQKKNFELTVSAIGGSLNYLPIYIAQQEGWFDEAGIKVKEVLFTNGPVQMESLSSNGWDLGCTGVGGTFAGVLGYDALVLGASNTDDGTQYIFARNDSDIVKAGKGHNKLNGEIYGDAESWKGKSVLCNTGSVTQYVLIKMLEGFGLTMSDVKFVAMDPATAYSAFMAGEGDACVLTGAGGTFKMLAESGKYTAAASGPMVDSGLMCYFIANRSSYADPEKYEAMKEFMKVYFKSMDWIKENKDKAIDYCVDMNDENGSSMDRDTTAKYLEADTYYTLPEACDMLNNKAEGSSNTILDQRTLDVLDFFISVGNYKKGDNQRYMGHTDGKLLNEVLSETMSPAK